MKNIFIIDDKKNYWWLGLLSGILFLIFGLWIMASPIESFKALTIVFGSFTLLSGIIGLLFSFFNKSKHSSFYSFLFGGVFDVVLGLILIANPKTILVIITFIISAWIIYRAVFLIRAALAERAQRFDAWKTKMVYGISLLVLSIILLWHPEIIGITLGFWTALAFLFMGVFRVSLALKQKRGYLVG